MKSKIFSLFQVALIATLPASLGIAFGRISRDRESGHAFGRLVAIAAGISDGGFLGGYANLPNNTTQHALLWLPGSTKDLGTLGGTNSALLNQFAGFSETAAKDSLGQDFCGTGTHLVCLPLSAVYGNATSLPLLGGQNGTAFGNNILGTVVGTAQTSVSDAGCLVGGKPIAPFTRCTERAGGVDPRQGLPAAALPRRPGGRRKRHQRSKPVRRRLGGLRECSHRTWPDLERWQPD